MIPSNRSSRRFYGRVLEPNRVPIKFYGFCTGTRSMVRGRAFIFDERGASLALRVWLSRWRRSFAFAGLWVEFARHLDRRLTDVEKRAPAFLDHDRRLPVESAGKFSNLLQLLEE